MTIDELKPYGIEEMREEEIEQFIETQSTGILGLQGDEMPYLVPLSYAYDGNESLYFTYILGANSEKERLTAETDRTRFLIYQVDTMFSWRSVLLEGAFEPVRPSEWSEIADLLEDIWRPEVFRVSSTSRNVKIYEFRLTDFSGIKHTGLSNELEETTEG